MTAPSGNTFLKIIKKYKVYCGVKKYEWFNKYQQVFNNVQRVCLNIFGRFMNGCNKNSMLDEAR